MSNCHGWSNSKDFYRGAGSFLNIPWMLCMIGVNLKTAALVFTNTMALRLSVRDVKLGQQQNLCGMMQLSRPGSLNCTGSR